MDRTTGLGQTVARHASRQTQVATGELRRLAQHLIHGTQLSGNTDKALRQRVMQFARQTGALGQHQGVLMLQLMPTKLI